MKDLLQAVIFSGFSSWEAVSYQKEVAPKILRFEIRDAEEVRPLYLASIISRDEKMAWQSFQDVLEHTAGLAQAAMHGFFGFDVLSVDIQLGMRNFDSKALSQLIINHARDLGPDQKTLIRYGQLFALLHYRAPADWGKIEVKTHVEFFNREPASSSSNSFSEESVRAALAGRGAKKQSWDEMDLFFKKIINKGGKEPNAIYIAHDLSVKPLWDPANETQQQRMRVWLEKEQQTRNGVLPEIYYYHAGERIPVKG
jgi:hypothetical protein